MEAVEDGADRLANAAEGVLEEFYGRVELVVEHQANAAKALAAGKADERKEEIKTILKQAEQKESATTAAPGGEISAAATNFLGQREGLPHPFAGGAVLALVAFMALLLVAAKFQNSNREVSLHQRPILG